MAIVLIGTAALAVASASGTLDWSVAVALGPASVVVALLGWVDDHRNLSARTRAVGHLGAAIWLTFWLGGLPAIRIGTASVQLGPVGTAMAVLGVVWATNLYNFMDGIDGLAAGEAAVGGSASACLLAAAHSQGLAAVACGVAAGSAGFLVWNLPPARIFMGDVGSGFIGFMFAGLALASEKSGGPPLLAWLIIFSPFIYDATITLLRRAFRGHALAEPHRDHAYQRAVRSGLSHGMVTAVIVGSTAVLGLVAGVTSSHPASVPAALVASYTAVAILYALVERRLPLSAKV